MVKVVVTTLLVLIALFAVPRIIVRDSNTISPEEIACIKWEADIFFDNPVERVMIQSFEVVKKESGATWVNAYTLCGLKYAIAEVTCQGKARIIRRLF